MARSKNADARRTSSSPGGSVMPMNAACPRSPMARHKTLQALAHNLCASFVSGLNWGEHDHVLAEALRECRVHDEESFCIDLLAGTSSFPANRVASVREAAVRYQAALPGWAEAVQSDVRLLRSATITVRFALGTASEPTVYSPGVIIEPASTFTARADLVDDRLKTWIAVQKGEVEFVPRWKPTEDGGGVGF